MKRIFLKTILIFLSSFSLFSINGEKGSKISPLVIPTILNDLVSQDTFYVQTSDCLLNGDVCIDISFIEIGNYIFSEGGNMYLNGYIGCMESVTSSYDYGQLYGQGNIGPYMLDSWEVEGIEFTGIFANISDLVDSMNLWDPTGNWTEDVSNKTINGGDSSFEYFPMDVTSVSINLPYIIPLVSTNSFEGTSINLSVGTHWIQVIDNGGGLCIDSFFVDVRCIQTNIEDFTLVEDSIHIFCFDHSELIGQPVSTQILCPSTGPSPAEFNLIGGNSCLEITALSVGQDTACYVFCDEYGFCDTTFINVIIESAPLEIGQEWIFETIFSNTSEQICIDTSNLPGTVNGIYNACPTQSGEYVIFSINPLTYCVDYTAVDIGKDTACIFIVDDLGFVDTTYIVACVSNPSIDTIIQNLVLGDTLITCMDSTQLGGDLILINNICENIGGIVNFSLDTLTYCTEVIASQIGQESACIIVCDNFGICDTTILVINITETAPMFLHAADDNEFVLYTGNLTLDVCFNDVIPNNQSLTDYFILPKVAGGMDTKFGTVSFASECNINYTPDGIECGVIDSFVYVICNNVGCDTALVTISLECEPIEGVNLIFSNGFSPNGDEVNQFFEIQGAENYPNNSLSIFNRWGNEVFQSDYYKNDWEGTFNGARLISGTYFYLFNDGLGKMYTGYVYIQN
ncbi:gliding motility-associated C-terminal domain-containing protein [Saprospiraceae bacterium]|nr:gliding motility-associated C-terminal domain-containing protein [Saprospiraceae bacterium]